MNPRSYILFCAGEDSGDILGSEAVAAVCSMGFSAKGAGGARMLDAGLELLIPYENLPVSGFGDVLPRYFCFRKYFEILCKALKDPLCKAFIAIDYPGFNMRLMAEADRFSKPVFYIAPPQIWAWKHNRGSHFANRSVAVLFEMEREVYERFGALATRLCHPFLEAAKKLPLKDKHLREDEILLLPGSRLGQVRRNKPLYEVIAKLLQQEASLTPVIIASRPALVPVLEKMFAHQYEVRLSPKKATLRAEFFANAKAVLSAPGTATLEATLCGTPVLVCARIDPLTYFAGKCFLKTSFLAIPNILLNRSLIEEIIVPSTASITKTAMIALQQIQRLSIETFELSAKDLFPKLEGETLGNWVREKVKGASKNWFAGMKSSEVEPEQE